MKAAMEAQKKKKENSDWGTQMLSWKRWCLSWTKEISLTETFGETDEDRKTVFVAGASQANGWI